MRMAATKDGTEMPSTVVLTRILSSQEWGLSAAVTPSAMPPVAASSMAASASQSVPGKLSSSRLSTSLLL